MAVSRCRTSEYENFTIVRPSRTEGHTITLKQVFPRLSKHSVGHNNESRVYYLLLVIPPTSLANLHVKWSSINEISFQENDLQIHSLQPHLYLKILIQCRLSFLLFG